MCLLFLFLSLVETRVSENLLEQTSGISSQRDLLDGDVRVRGRLTCCHPSVELRVVVAITRLIAVALSRVVLL